MDFSAKLDDLQQRAAQAKQAAQAAVTESRDQLRQRIDQAKVDVDLAAKDAQQDASAAAADARSKWAQMKADAAAKMDDLQTRIDKRADQIDANVAADDAAWAEDDAAAAIDYAAWTVDNARLAVLDAIDARVYADEPGQHSRHLARPDRSGHGPAVGHRSPLAVPSPINLDSRTDRPRGCCLPAGRTLLRPPDHGRDGRHQPCYRPTGLGRRVVDRVPPASDAQQRATTKEEA